MGLAVHGFIGCPQGKAGVQMALDLQKPGQKIDRLVTRRHRTGFARLAAFAAFDCASHSIAPMSCALFSACAGPSATAGTAPSVTVADASARVAPKAGVQQGGRVWLS